MDIVKQMQEKIAKLEKERESSETVLYYYCYVNLRYLLYCAVTEALI